MEDTDCCGAMPCDGDGSTCGCPKGFTWDPDYLGGSCVFSEADCTAPPSDCDTNPYQTGCIRDSPFPFSSTEGCCYFDTYEGTTYYDWDVAHITTY